MSVATIGSARRVRLDAGSWVDVVPRWLPGATALYDRLAAKAQWRQGQLWRYERWITEPRLGASSVEDGQPVDPILSEARRRLVERYHVDFDRGALAWYRDGRDSVAFHRDREMRWLDDTVVAILTLGGPRPFQMKSLRGDDQIVFDVAPEDGDLLVLGGRCQADWLHAVPKVYALDVPGRISVQWRWASHVGVPDQNPSYRAPRNYSA